ncbi:MAG: RdgB/HAM1 family non-canonical purine NTP pyrophosphatase [Planctomycetota bacterium]
MRTIVLATRNAHKVDEIRDLLSDLPVRIVAADEVEGLPEVEETGTTLEENAELKANAIARAAGLWALADDTGLEVEALGGAPGVYSARYAFEGCSYEDNNRKLLSELADLPDDRRSARFRCVLALADPKGILARVDGIRGGRILREIRGEGGFGYDPVFFDTELGKTFAELSRREKGLVSHRGQALRRMRDEIARLLAESEETTA